MTRHLRVLSISTLFPSSARPGFGLFVERQANALAARGDVDLVMVNPLAIAPWLLDRVFNTAAERTVPRLEDGRGYPVHHPRFTWLPRLGPRWNPALIARAVLPLARRLHAEAPFDLVDAQFFYPDGPAAARIASALGLPLSIKARGSDIHLWGAKAFARRQMLDAAAQAAGLLAVSGALRDDMIALGMPGERIAVHHTGLDHARFRPAPRPDARDAVHAALGLPSDGRLVASVGNLIPLKGHDLAIRALATLPETRLAITGHGPERHALQTLAAELGIADRVHLTGAVSPALVPTLLCAADAFVLASEREGLANAWIEALACGTPIVITDVGGAREVVRTPQAGRIVARTPEAISAALVDLLDAPPAQADVAACAADFSWEANAAQLAAHYARVAGSRA